MSFKKKVVLCGGTGFVGQELGLSLVKRGYDVIVLSRDPEKHQGKMPYPCSLGKFSRGDIAEVGKALDGAFAVVNLAGAGVDEGTWNFKGEDSVYGSRVESVKTLVEALAKTAKAPKVFVQASGVGYYGKQTAACTESAPPGSTYLAKVAQDLEKESEKAEGFGLRHVAIRLGVVLGLGGALDEINLLYAAGIGSRFIGGEKIPLPWIHMDDAVNVILHAIETENCKGVVNAVAPKPATLADLHSAMTNQQGIQLTPPIPTWGLRLLMKNRAALLFDNAEIVPKYLIDAGFRFQASELSTGVGSLFNREANGQFRLVCKQFVSADIDEVWSFFSKPQNLETITPPWLQFRIQSVSDENMRAGTEIVYKLRLKGVPLSWKSVITNSVPGKKFIDEQLKGPYKTWHHTHLFEPMNGGVLITDDVSWRLPVGKPGALVAAALVRRDVRTIFSYRADVVARLFNRTGGQQDGKLLSSADLLRKQS